MVKNRLSAVILTVICLCTEVIEFQCYIIRNNNNNGRNFFEINSNAFFDPVEYESSEETSSSSTELDVANGRLDNFEEKNNKEAYSRIKQVEDDIKKHRENEIPLPLIFNLEELNKPDKPEDISADDYVIDNWLANENSDSEEYDDFNDVNYYYSSKNPADESKDTVNYDILRLSPDVEESRISSAEDDDNILYMDSDFITAIKRNLFGENGNRQLTKDYKNSEKTNLSSNDENNSLEHESQIAQNNEEKYERNVGRETDNENRDYRKIVERQNENSDADSSEDEDSVTGSQGDSTESDTAAVNTDVISEVDSNESKEDDVFYNSMVTKIAKLYGYDSKEQNDESSFTHDSSEYDDDDDDDDFAFSEDEENNNAVRVLRNNNETYKDVYNVSKHNINKKHVKDINNSKYDDDTNGLDDNDDDGDDENDDEGDIDDAENHNDEDDNDDDDDDDDEGDDNDDDAENHNDEDDNDDDGDDDDKNDDEGDDNDDDAENHDDEDDNDDEDKDDDQDEENDVSDNSVYFENNDDEVKFKNSWDIIRQVGKEGSRNSETAPRSAQGEGVVCAFGWRPNSAGVCQPATEACERGFVRNYAGDCINPGIGYEKY